MAIKTYFINQFIMLLLQEQKNLYFIIIINFMFIIIVKVIIIKVQVIKYFIIKLLVFTIELVIIKVIILFIFIIIELCPYLRIFKYTKLNYNLAVQYYSIPRYKQLPINCLSLLAVRYKIQQIYPTLNLLTTNILNSIIVARQVLLNTVL